TTVNGATLNAAVVDGAVVLTDAAGGTATVTATDVAASNGLIHVIDTVVMPG
ncbi:MAG: fasciclin domain-containing protein, partial [Erythrobacter sp.]|nr:fasciclin domain-containing protein [Erythrobacter sp.]